MAIRPVSSTMRATRPSCQVARRHGRGTRPPGRECDGRDAAGARGRGSWPPAPAIAAPASLASCRCRCRRPRTVCVVPREGTALLLPALSDRADAGWLPLPAVQLRQWRDAGDCTPCRGCLLATVRRARQPTRPGARSAPARSRGRCPGTVALRRRVASSLPACTRSRARGVLVFGGVGPPRRCVCHDRGPGRVGGPCVSRGAQAGGVRPLPPPATRRCRGPCALTRCRVVRGGGVMRCAGRRVWPGEAAGGLAPPAPAAPDRRPAGPRRRAVPARE